MSTVISMVLFIRLSSRMRSSVECRTSLICTYLMFSDVGAGERGHSPDDLGDPLDVVVDDVQAVLCEFIRRHFAQELGKGGNGSERIADLMGNACREPAERGKLFGVHDLLFELFCCGGPLVDLVLELDGIQFERFFELHALGDVGAGDAECRAFARRSGAD